MGSSCKTLPNINTPGRGAATGLITLCRALIKPPKDDEGKRLLKTGETSDFVRPGECAKMRPRTRVTPKERAHLKEVPA